MYSTRKKLYWQLDLRYNVTLDNDIFRVLPSSLTSFISSSTSIGPDGEIELKESFSFKINFVPTKSGTYRMFQKFAEKYDRYHREVFLDTDKLHKQC
ncbi:unnamed protein product [Rotaria sp. Silwood1]|nr:unnamed protein product [Rotaria sp. Silwood1]